MKKGLCLLISVCLLLALAACGGEEGGVSSSDPSADGAVSAESYESNESKSGDDEVSDVLYTESFDENGKYIPLNYDFPKLMKLTQWDLSEGLLLNSSGTPLNESAFRKKAAQVMQNILDDGYNTVMLQMRPFADSFYKSEYYPLSYFVTGSYSVQSVDYDCVQIFIDEAHKRGLSIHGWINPMRCMTKAEIEKVTGDWAITDWYSHMGDGGEYSEYMFAGTDAGGTARLYLNPAYEEVRSLIINGVDEILSNYHVDGVFMDDYFYPEEVKGNTEIDAKAYAVRTDGSSAVLAFRRNNVNALVRGIYSKVKEHGEGYIYGISPNGDISHAYSDECADIYTWCSEAGYCDVMYPQYYYGMIHGQVSVSTLMKQWTDVLMQDGIKLVPVLTLHKAGASDQWAVKEDAKSEWIDHSDVILESLTYLLVNEYRQIDGVGFFCYQFFHGNSSKNKAVKAEVQNFSPIWPKYETYVGKSKEELVELYAEEGLDLVALAADWDNRLLNTGRFMPLFEIEG